MEKDGAMRAHAWCFSGLYQLAYVHLMLPFKCFSSWDKGHFAVHSATLGWMKTSAIDLSWVRRRKVKPSDGHAPEG